MTEPTHWLIWDGKCGFCRKSVEWVKLRDRENLFRAVPFQEAPSPPMTPELYERAKQSVQVVLPDGRVLEAGEASAYVLGRIGYRWLERIMRFPLFRPITEWGYRRVANNRDFFAKILFRK